MKDSRICLLDLEMTGTDVHQDRICEIAALRVEGGLEVGRLCTLINPERELGDSTRIHGIRDEEVVDAAKLTEIREKLRSLLTGAVIVGHRIDFDLAFLHEAGGEESARRLEGETKVLLVARPRTRTRTVHFYAPFCLERKRGVLAPHKLYTRCQS